MAKGWHTMSTVYYLVNPEREKAFSDFEKAVNAIKDVATERVSAIDVPSYLEDVKDDIVDTIRRRTLAGLIDGTEYDKSIGTKSMTGFRWHTENGFHDLLSVERFLSENQGYEIQDEYHETFSLEQLRKLSES